MTSLAARVARWLERGSPVQLAAPASGPTPTGVPILTQQFGTGLYLTVEIAWGADPYADPSTWSWTDVTKDVLYGDGGGAITITPGRLDESSTPSPAQCSLTVNNSTGRYTQGGQSPNWPNVKRGVPLRVRVVYQGVSNIRFQGYVASFTPSWDTTGNYSVVAILAAGVKRRLVQKKSLVTSPLTRHIPSGSPVAYWPLEENAHATWGVPGITGGYPILPIDESLGGGVITWAADTTFPGSLQSPMLKAGMYLVGTLAGSSAPWTVLFGLNVDLDSGAEAYAHCSTFDAELLYNTDGSVDLNVTLSGQITSTTVLTVDTVNTNNVWYWYWLSCQQSGGNILFTLGYRDTTGSGVITTATGTIAGTASQVNKVVVGSPTGTTAPIGFSQVAVFNGTYSTISSTITGYFAGAGPTASNGFNGEYVQTRMARLAGEQNEFISVAPGHSFQLVGAQQSDSYLNLMEDCAQVDQGILYDGFLQGLSYISQDEITSTAAALTLDASLGQLADQVAPIDDDQQTVNTYAVTRTNGATYTFQDTVSSQSISNIGIYDDSATVDLYSDGQQLQDYASWQVGIGTFSGYRFPNAELWLHRNPELLAQWLAAYIGCRMTITNLIDVRSQLQLYALDQIVQGWSESIDQFTWSVTTNCTAYDVWRVGEIAQPTGDTNPFVLRPDTDGSTTVAQVHPGDATCQVAVNAGALWTTNTDDFPIDLNIGGYEVAVTAISGSSSPQTFTLSWHTPLPPTPIQPGSAVSLWAPTVLDVLAM